MTEPSENLVIPEGVGAPSELEAETEVSLGRLVYSLWRLVLAVRYRKNLVLAVMATGLTLGGLYYLTAVRRYASRAALLVSYTGRDKLDTALTDRDSLRQNAMPTFVGMVRSAKVLGGAIRSLPAEDRLDLAGCPEENWVEAVRANLSVQAVRATSILQISYASKNPRVAADVVRAIVQSYLDLMDHFHRGTAGEIRCMLTTERKSLLDEFNRKQRKLLEVRRHFADMGFRSDGTTLHPMVQRAVSFNDALIAVQKERVEQEAALAALRTALRNGQDLGQYVMSVADSVGRDVLANTLGLTDNQASAYAAMQQALLSAQADLQAMRQNLGPAHPDVVALSEKIRATQQYLQASRNRVEQGVAALRHSQLGPWLLEIAQQKLAELRRKEQILQARFEQARSQAINLSGQMAQIELLDRDVKRLGNMNEVLLNQIAAIDLQQNGQDVRVTVTEEPVVNDAPVSPRLGRTALCAVVGSFLVALGLVTLMDTVDDRFRSLDELQSRLGLSVLSTIPQLPMPAEGGLESLPCYTSPKGREGESFRTLRTALMLAHQEARHVVLTSSEPGDGKSTVVANLAVCFAQADKRTLVIDADLRRPGLTNLLKMRGARGLSEVLRGSGEIGRTAAAHINSTALPRLDVLPSGPRPADPAELLTGSRFSQLLAWAETVYDHVLIDSPPMLAAVDAAVMGRVTDGVMVLIQPAKNRRRPVMRAIDRLKLMEIPVLGLVVNRAGSKEDHGYYDYEYGYGYHYDYGAVDARGDEVAAGRPGDQEVRAGGSHPRTVRQSLSDRQESAERRMPRRVA